MRSVRDPMKNVTRQEWVERVDHQAYAVLARAQETWRGGIYAASTFLLVPAGTRRWQAIKEARDKLDDEMRRRVHVRAASPGAYMHRFGMPLIAWLRDLRR